MPVNGENKQWHEQPALVKSNSKSILVFVKHSPGNASCRKGLSCLNSWFKVLQTKVMARR